MVNILEGETKGSLVLLSVVLFLDGGGLGGSVATFFAFLATGFVVAAPPPLPSLGAAAAAAAAAAARVTLRALLALE